MLDVSSYFAFRILAFAPLDLSSAYLGSRISSQIRTYRLRRCASRDWTGVKFFSTPIIVICIPDSEKALKNLIYQHETDH
jgi:hypothetical protein